MPSPDASLWTDFLAGDERAYERLFLTFYDELYGYGMRLSNDGELVKDSIQNLFQRLWQRRTELRAVEAVRPYLFKSLRHEVAKAIKAQQRRSWLQSSYSEEFKVQYSPEDFIIAQQLTAEQHARLLGALGQLSNRQREAIYLKFFDGFSYERIAEIMALNQQSIRNLIYQGTQSLRRSLTPVLLLVLLHGGERVCQ
ncbi:RNA polymerase sigma factor [Hymenobacter nivis]|uniref:Sigma-70 family RNA polymerase sigma factor n=1 Tax=Hymenobacter nivis TaxID=1850093 RepID=A0A502GWV8_9BACT|nr:sigma-70 family RNA polymerase sigma factor [Hymenobacter nivis]TPG66364.1 sigma-70 family RNA polymerase sigma factor [Hymenobacter nivis]